MRSIARCAHCGAPDPIRGDGEQRLVCARCVAALTRIAAEPRRVHPAVIARLLGRSIDVVHVLPGLAGWRWTSLWPGKGDHSLLPRRAVR